METTVAAKKITTFRLNEELLERLKVLAKRENRSLNNFVEYTLMEVASGVELETLDMDNFRRFGR